jgi:hypothetical protein
MKLWLDDVRPAPKEYDLHVMTAADAIQWLKTGQVDVISLDHDLGDPKIYGDGYDVARWIERAAHDGALGRIAWALHTANPVGFFRMRQALQQAEKYWAQRGI